MRERYRCNGSRREFAQGSRNASSLTQDGTGAYGYSKTANALLSVGIAHRWRDDWITSNAVNPGAIATGLQKHTGGLKTPLERRKMPEQGAAPSVLLVACST